MDSGTRGSSTPIKTQHGGQRGNNKIDTVDYTTTDSGLPSTGKYVIDRSTGDTVGQYNRAYNYWFKYKGNGKVSF